MAVNNLVKRIQKKMRQDAGINGDAQRIEQMVWMFFLKVYDAQEYEWEIDATKASSPTTCVGATGRHRRMRTEK